MKARQLLIILGTFLQSLALAQQTDQVAPQRVQRPEAIAMGNLKEVVLPGLPITGEFKEKVVAAIVIDKEGKVIEASMLSGQPILRVAALERCQAMEIPPLHSEQCAG
jgi:hypothetical protein